MKHWANWVNWHCTKNKVFPIRISSVNVSKPHLLKNSLMENFIFCAV